MVRRTAYGPQERDGWEYVSPTTRVVISDKEKEVLDRLWDKEHA